MMPFRNFEIKTVSSQATPGKTITIITTTTITTGEEFSEYIVPILTHFNNDTADTWRQFFTV